MKNLFILLVFFGLLGCSGENGVSTTAEGKQPAPSVAENTENLPVVDNSSDDSYERTATLVRASVPQDAQEDYAGGLVAITAMATKAVKNYSPQMIERLQKATEITRKIEDGKNYKQVIAFSKEMMNTITAQAKKDFMDNFSKSEEALKSNNASDPTFTKIEISGVELQNGQGTMRVKNNTPYALLGLMVTGIDLGQENTTPDLHLIVDASGDTPILPNKERTVKVVVLPGDTWESVSKPDLKDIIWAPVAFDNNDNGERMMNGALRNEVKNLLFFKEGYATLERQNREELFNDKFLIEVLGDKAEEYFKQRNFI